MSKAARKIYEQHHGKLPPGYEVHHIIPQYCDGTDCLSNLVALSVEDHSKAHQELYEKYGRIEDLLASKLIGDNRDIKVLRAKLGGKAGGSKQKELGIGIHRGTYEDKKERCLAARKIQDELKSNQFVYVDRSVQSDRGKKGGPKNKGFIWYYDGTKSQKYTRTQQETVPFIEFLRQNPTYIEGHGPVENIECPHCGLIGTSKAAMYRHHFDNCKRKRNED